MADGKIEGDQNNNGKDYGEKTEDGVEKEDGIVVGGIIDKYMEDDDDDDEGPHKTLFE